MNFDRIAVEPDKLEGKPAIRGLRISVETVVRLVAAGWSFDEILLYYPHLEREDIKQALEYAAASTSTSTASTSPRVSFQDRLPESQIAPTRASSADSSDK